MAIQIFGRSKCFDTKKAQRYFKERNQQVHCLDLDQKPLSKRELESVLQGAGGMERCVQKTKKNEDTFLRYTYMPSEDRFDYLLEHQELLVTPIVRDGAKATCGYAPEIWKLWI